MSTQQQSRITVSVDGESLGAFDACTVGSTSAEVTKRRTADGERTWPAKNTHEDKVVSRVFERERDHELARRLKLRTGRAMVTITEQPLDDDDMPWGKPTVSNGRLSAVSTGDADVQSSEPRVLELTVVVTEVA